MAILSSHKIFRAGSGENFFSCQKFWKETRAIFRPLIFLAALTCFGIQNSVAQTISHEHELKAVFLFNFAQFTDWPTNAFASDDVPFVIGVLGSDPVADALEKTVANETLGNRKFLVKKFTHVEEVQNCQILFISQTESRRLDKIINALKDQPVLTVSDIENSAYRGVCVRFLKEENKIHLQINLDSLKAANLTMSSKLLRLAEVVDSTK
jgi:hypothetical protein